MTAAERAPDRQRILVEALHAPACYPHPVGRVRHLETHSAHVLLTGDFAYKIKKPVDLGFLDFSSLEKRRFYCAEEVRLNRRLAPELYLEVVPIGGTPESPRLGDGAAPIEYAVRMREFPQADLLDARLERGELGAGEIDAVADEVAEFHGRIDAAGAGSGFGTATGIEAPMRQNFEQIRACGDDPATRQRLSRLEAWSVAEHGRLLPVFAARQAGGFVREAHGDLHLGNIARIDGRIRIFDCIEFNPNLRWIDVANEIAFFAMDAARRGRPDFAWRFINRYLEQTGDYAAVDLLRYYRVYRALVRAKVARIRAGQPAVPSSGRGAALAEYAASLELAEAIAAPGRPALVAMHGYSGAGKSTAALALGENLPGVRIRSDVERKRLAGLAPAARSGAGVGDGLYGEDATRRTYAELARLAETVVVAGYPAIVDAALLVRWQRTLLRDRARAAGVPFVIVSCAADADTLLGRIAARGGDDASEATAEVLARQMRTADPLDAGEADRAVVFDAAGGSPEALVRTVAATVDALYGKE